MNKEKKFEIERRQKWSHYKLGGWIDAAAKNLSNRNFENEFILNELLLAMLCLKHVSSYHIDHDENIKIGWQKKVIYI